MLRKLSIALALSGFAVFMTIFGLVMHHKPDPHALAWPMMTAVWMMAVGMIGLSITVSRQARVRSTD